jgi:uncharacterized membrane-anchored protein
MRININEEEVRHILKMHSKEREKTIKKIISEAGPYEDEEIPVSNTATNVTPVSTTTTNVTPVSNTATNVTPVSNTATNVTPVSNTATNVTPVSNTTTNVTPVSNTATNVTPVSNTATNATFVSNRAMQKWLNTNKQSGLDTDNRIGPKTIDAINKALGITTQQTTQQTTTALEPVKNETSTSGEVGTQI